MVRRIQRLKTNASDTFGVGKFVGDPRRPRDALDEAGRQAGVTKAKTCRPWGAPVDQKVFSHVDLKCIGETLSLDRS